MTAGSTKAPFRSRWDQEGVEFVASDTLWITRCAARMVACDRYLEMTQAIGLALELSSTDSLCALCPEIVAEDLLRVDSGLR